MIGRLKAWAYERHPDVVRIFQLIRYETLGHAAHIAGRLSPAKRRFLSGLNGKKGLKLNIASGGEKREGWISVDVSLAADIRMDLRKPLPFGDGSASLIFCEHFCDHLNYPFMIKKFLSQCNRILEPGGRARFIMHDARDLARAYLENDTKYFHDGNMGGLRPSEGVNLLYRFNDFHQFLYDFETFERLLKEAGFSQVIRSSFLHSEIPGLVLDVNLPDRPALSMYIEAIK